LAFEVAVDDQFSDELLAVEDQDVVAGDECGQGCPGVFGAERDDRVLQAEVAVAAAGAGFDGLGERAWLRRGWWGGAGASEATLQGGGRPREFRTVTMGPNYAAICALRCSSRTSLGVR
jgi:hypothetical protein